MRRILIKLGLALVGTLVVLGGLELLVRALDLAPKPGPNEGRTRLQGFHDTFYQLDEQLVFRMPPGLESDFSEYLENVSGPIHLSDRGYRIPGFQSQKQAETFRIVCLGDSVTFGYGAGDLECYPARLAEKLRAESDRPLEVINLGVPGYSTYQGIRMMELEVEPLSPDLLIVGFGFNDSFLKRQSEAEYHRQLLATRRGFGKLLADGVDALSDSALYRLIAASLAPGAESRGFQLDSSLHPRVPVEEYRDHLRSIVERARANGIAVVLINTDFPNAYPRQTLADLAGELKVPYVDLPRHFESDVGYALGGEAIDLGELPAAGAGETTVLLQMKVPGIRALPPDEEEKYLVEAIVLADPAKRPNHVSTRMRDNGDFPDLAARDGIWTATVTVPAPSRGEIAFRLAAGMGTQFRSLASFYNSVYFHRLEIPEVAEGRAWKASPVPFNNCPYKSWMLPQEDIHPNAEGYDRMATHIADVVRTLEVFPR
ncbi:MAG: GDSL-type esterase/lipase family protein [Planctomycetota bacterium]